MTNFGQRKNSVMKVTLIALAVAALSLAACKSNQNSQTDSSAASEPEVTAQIPEPEAAPAENTKYNPNDARTFGLVGPVQEVRYSKALLSTTSPEEQGDPWLESDELELTFDEYGRVTLDGLRGCKYVYDENGIFIKGFSDKTVMKRDDNGRIISYANTNIEGVDDYSKINFDEYIGKAFEYDELGRVAKQTQSGWEWMTEFTYTYFGGNVYPKTEKYDSTAESLVIEGTVEYEYLKYDNNGNWLERNTKVKEITRDCGGAGDPETVEYEYLEKRVIKYYSN